MVSPSPHTEELEVAAGGLHLASLAGFVVSAPCTPSHPTSTAQAGRPPLPSLPPTLKISMSLLVTSFLALCFQGTRKTFWAGLIQQSPGYKPLSMAFSSHGPKRSFWASLRGHGAVTVGGSGLAAPRRGAGPPARWAEAAAYPSLSAAAMVSPLPSLPSWSPLQQQDWLGGPGAFPPNLLVSGFPSAGAGFYRIDSGSGFPGNHVGLPKLKLAAWVAGGGGWVAGWGVTAPSCNPWGPLFTQGLPLPLHIPVPTVQGAWLRMGVHGPPSTTTVMAGGEQEQLPALLCPPESN